MKYNKMVCNASALQNHYDINKNKKVHNAYKPK